MQRVNEPAWVMASSAVVVLDQSGDICHSEADPVQIPLRWDAIDRAGKSGRAKYRGAAYGDHAILAAGTGPIELNGNDARKTARQPAHTGIVTRGHNGQAATARPLDCRPQHAFVFEARCAEAQVGQMN